MGATRQLVPLDPLIRLVHRDGTPTDGLDGFRSSNGRIWGTYFHGLFDMPEFRSQFLSDLKLEYRAPSQGQHQLSEFRNQQYNLLADHLRNNLGLAGLWFWLGCILTGWVLWYVG